MHHPVSPEGERGRRGHAEGGHRGRAEGQPWGAPALPPLPPHREEKITATVSLLGTNLVLGRSRHMGHGACPWTQGLARAGAQHATERFKEPGCPSAPPLPPRMPLTLLPLLSPFRMPLTHLPLPSPFRMPLTHLPLPSPMPLAPLPPPVPYRWPSQATQAEGDKGQRRPPQAVT